MGFFSSHTYSWKKIVKNLNFRSNQTIVSFISTITISELKKMIKVKADIVRAIPLPPISLKKGPVPICPANKKVKNFFNKIGSTIEIKNEKIESKCGWSPFDGHKFKGAPVYTIINGEIKMKDGEILGEASGKPLKFDK